jgi:hypothetical protein
VTPKRRAALKKAGWVVNKKTLDTIIGLNAVKVGDEIIVGERRKIQSGYCPGGYGGRRVLIEVVEEWEGDNGNYKCYRDAHGFGVVDVHVIAWRRPR